MDRQYFDQFLQSAGAELLEKAGRLLDAKVAAWGPQSFDELPPSAQETLYREAIMETAVQVAGADLNLLSRVLDATFNPRFQHALKRTLSEINGAYDAFDLATGADHALLLAFFGLPVAPMETESGDLVGTPTTDMARVVDMFDNTDAHLVGYITSQAPFYVIFGDCQDSLAEHIANTPKLERVRALFERDGLPLPTPQGEPFVKVCGLFRRYPGEEVGGLMYMDPHPDRGSFMLYAGWTEANVSKGVVQGGRKPVPRQLLYTLLQMPDAHSFVMGTGKPPTQH